MNISKEINFQYPYMTYVLRQGNSHIKVTTVHTSIAKLFDDDRNVLFEKVTCKNRKELKRFNLTSLKSIKKGSNIAVFDGIDTTIEVKGSLGLIKNFGLIWSDFNRCALPEFSHEVAVDVTPDNTFEVVNPDIQSVIQEVHEKVNEGAKTVRILDMVKDVATFVKSIALIKVW